jgi:6-phosphogluconolactonase
VHESTLTANNTILVNDLGLNAVYHYQLLAQQEPTIINPSPLEVTYVSAPTAGPRHLVTHPYASFAFVMNELDSTMSSYAFDRSTGALLGSELVVVSTLRPDENCTDMNGGELQVSADGKFLYASNRDNSSPNENRSSVVVYAIDTDTGGIETIQHISTMGEHPRHFNLFLDGTVMLVANMNSDNIVTFTVDKVTGLLSPPTAAGFVVKTTAPTQILSAN